MQCHLVPLEIHKLQTSPLISRLYIHGVSQTSESVTNSENGNLTIQSVSHAETAKPELYKLASRFKQGQSR